jgi:hypothetical protein
MLADRLDADPPGVSASRDPSKADARAYADRAELYALSSATLPAQHSYICIALSTRRRKRKMLPKGNFKISPKA